MKRILLLILCMLATCHAQFGKVSQGPLLNQNCNFPSTLGLDVVNNKVYSCGSLGIWSVSTVLTGSGAPSGSCTAEALYVDNAAGNPYVCKAGVWSLVSTGGGPANTSTSLTFGVLNLPVTNLKVISNAYQIGMGTGDIDMYTVPGGKKALVIDGTYTVPTGNPSAITSFAEFKVSGVYTKYDFISNAQPAGTIGTLALLVPMLLNAGESFAVNCNNAGLSFWPLILEFDAAASINIARISTFTVGDNTVLTVSTSGLQIMSNLEGVGAGSPMKGTLWYFNNTGLSRTIGWNVVPSGGSPGVSNQIATGLSVSSPAVSVKNFYGGLKAADFVTVNTDANTAGQVAWIIYQSLP